MQKHNFFVKQIFFQDEVEILTFFDGDDDEDEYSCNSVNFQARFCIEVDLHNTYNMILMKMMIMTMMMMMKMIIALTQSIFELGPPDLA